MSGWVRRGVVILLVAPCAVVAACTADEASSPAETPAVKAGQEVRPDVRVTVVEPSGAPADVVVLLVPGGGWVSADPGGLAPLASYLADRGATVASTTYRTASDGSYFPAPVQDVGCALAFAAAQAPEDFGGEMTVAVVGHSAGAQLAAVAALDPETAAGSDCPFPRRDADRLVGLAGPYDVVAAAGQAQFLFGPESPNPDEWDAGNPLELAENRPGLPVLLVHGTADDLVPLEASETFADALTAGGHAVELTEVDGVDHMAVFSAEVAGPVVAEWLGLEDPAP